jgi:hypothetical protein
VGAGRSGPGVPARSNGDVRMLTWRALVGGAKKMTEESCLDFGGSDRAGGTRWCGNENARGERASGLGKGLEYRGLFFFFSAPLEWSARLYRCV